MSVLTKDIICGKQDLEIEKVEVPEWGGDVFIRTLTAAERDQFDTSVYRQEGIKNYDNLRARYLCLCLCDEHGVRIFDDRDAEKLGTKSGKVMDRLFGIAQRINGMSPADVKEMVKNLDATQKKDSSTD